MKKPNLLALLVAIIFPLATQAQVLNEGFESWPPDEWTTIHVSGTVSWESFTTAHSGTRSASINYASLGHENYLVTPLLAPVAGDSLSFFASAQSYANTTLTIEVSTTTSEAAAFDTVLATYTTGSMGTLGTTSPTTWVNKTIDLSGFAGQNIYIAFHVVDDNGARLNIDDVTGVHLFMPSCPKVNNLTASYLTADSAVIGWNRRGSETSWLVYLNGEYVATATDSTYTFTDLTANTVYTAGVRAFCAEGDTSLFVNTPFRTGCALVTVGETPWTDNFESYAISTKASDIPCWHGLNYGATTVLDYPMLAATTGVSGTSGNSLYFYFGSSTAQREIAVLPQMSNLSELSVGFYVKGETQASFEVGVMTDPTADSTFVAFDTMAVPAGWTYFEVPLTDAGDAEYIAIRGRCPRNYFGFYVDDITVMQAPDCARPEGIALRDLTDNSATLFIDDPTANNNYNITLTHGTVVEEFTATDTLFDLTTLLPNTDYTLSVVSVCSSTTTTPNVLSFRTPCVMLTYEDLPYTMTFDSLPVTTETEIPCWQKLSFYSTYPGHPTVSAQNATTAGGHSLYFYVGNSSQPIYGILPAVDTLDGRMLTFKWRIHAQASLQVGTMSNPSDTATFTPVYTIAGGNGTSADWVEEEVSFAGTPDDVHYVAFRAAPLSSFGWPLYVDDVTLMEQPSCVRPNRIWFEEPTANSVVLHIVDPSASMSYAIAYGNDSTTTTDTVVTLENLTASTDYAVRVRTICEDGNVTPTFASGSFSTPCANIVVTATEPYNESFETWNNTFNRCWNRLQQDLDYDYYQTSGSYVPQVSTTQAHTGTSSLRMVSYYEEGYDWDDYEEYASYAFMPLFEAPMQGLQMNFWYRVPANATNVRLAVGVSSNVDDSSTFTRLMTIAPADTAWHQYEVDLGSYNGTGNRITFYQYYTSYNDGSYYGYIDDIHVEPAASCARPTSISVSDLTATSATLTWVDLNEIGTYKVVINGNEASAQVVNDTAVTLTVEADSVYTVAVSTLCDGQYTEPRTYTFHTPCAAIAHEELPWMENFDAVSTVNTTPMEAGCMRFVSKRNSYSTHYPYANSTTRYGESGNSLFFSPTYGQHQIAVLPLFADAVNTLMVSAQLYVSNASMPLAVGMMTNPSDASTLEILDTLMPSATGAWDYVEYRFDEYEGTANYIALCPLTYPSSGYGYIAVDNLTVSEIVDCQRVQNLALGSLDATEVTLTFADSLAQGSYRVWLTSTADTNTYTEDVFDLTATFSGLMPNTTYTAHVSTLCGGVPTTPVDLSFTTPCAAAAMPWGENFDSLSTSNGITYLKGNCWDFYSGTSCQIDSVLAGNGSLLSSVSNRSIRESEGSAFTTRHLVDNIYGTSHYAWTVTPAVAIEAPAALSFDMALTRWNSGSAAAGNLADDRFVVLLTADGGATWTPLAKWGSDTANRDNYLYGDIPAAGQTISFALDQYDGQNVRIAFYGESSVSGDDNSLRIDNLFIESASCMLPQGLTVGAVSGEEVTLSWTGDAAGYDYEYAIADDSNWVAGTTDENFVTLTGLSNSTQYNFRLRSNCGEDTSRWISTSFRTACGIISHADLPLVETFDSYASSSSAAIDPCWTRLNFYSTSTNYPYPTSYTRHGSTGNALYFSNGSSVAPEYLVTPAFDTLNDLYVNFWLYKSGTVPTMQVGVMDDPFDTTTFTLLETVSPEQTSRWEEFFVSFDQYTGAGKHIAFRVLSTNYSVIYLDDILVNTLNECVDTVRSFSVANVTDTEVDVLTTLGFGLSDSVVVTLGSATGTTLQTVVLDSVAPAHFSGLTAETAYQVSAKVYCGGDIVATAGPVDFSTRCNGGFEVEVSATTLDTTSGGSHNTPICSFYKHSMTQQVYLASELGNRAMNISSISFNYTNATPMSIYTGSIYVAHYAADSASLLFVPTDSMQLVYTGALDMQQGWNEFLFSNSFAYDGSSNLLLCVVADAESDMGSSDRFATHSVPNGRTAYFQNDNSTYSATSTTYRYNKRSDVKFGICGSDTTGPQPIDSCAAPTQVTARDITANSAVISWTENGNATAWIIDYNGQTVRVETNPYTLTGLSANTSYTVAVQALCGEGLESEWSDSYTFTTTNVGIDDVTGANIALYPNPAHSTVTLTGIDGEATVTVVDMNGRENGEWRVESGKLTIDVSGMAQGAYFVRIIGEQVNAIRKLIVR